MKQTLTLMIAVLLTATVWAQSPQKLSYQAVIRNNSNQLIANHAVGIKISIIQSSVSGTAVYVETQSATTNVNGLVSLEIGGGTAVSGNFSTIDWSNGPYFIKTETDPAGGVAYAITGTSQILSTPYALYSKKAESLNWNFISLNIYGSLLKLSGGSFAIGFGVNAGIVLNDLGFGDFSENFTVPANYNPGDTIFIRMIISSTATGTTNLLPNYLSVSRANVGYITGSLVTSGLYVPSINFTSTAIPMEVIGYITSPNTTTTIMPGDGISFGIFRNNVDANTGNVTIHSIELYYK